MPSSTLTQRSLKIFKTHHLAPNVGNSWLESHKHFKSVVFTSLCLLPFLTTHQKAKINDRKQSGKLTQKRCAKYFFYFNYDLGVYFSILALHLTKCLKLTTIYGLKTSDHTNKVDSKLLKTVILSTPIDAKTRTICRIYIKVKCP